MNHFFFKKKEHKIKNTIEKISKEKNYFFYNFILVSFHSNVNLIYSILLKVDDVNKTLFNVFKMN